MKRKTILAAIMAATMAVTLTACGGNSETADSSVTLQTAAPEDVVTEPTTSSTTTEVVEKVEEDVLHNSSADEEFIAIIEKVISGDHSESNIKAIQDDAKKYIECRWQNTKMDNSIEYVLSDKVYYVDITKESDAKQTIISLYSQLNLGMEDNCTWGITFGPKQNRTPVVNKVTDDVYTFKIVISPAEEVAETTEITTSGEYTTAQEEVTSTEETTTEATESETTIAE